MWNHYSILHVARYSLLLSYKWTENPKLEMGKSTFGVDALALGRKLIVLYKKAVRDVEKMEQRRINNGKIQISAFRIGSKSKEKPPISFEISGFYGCGNRA